jgi:hypothetical protein
MKQGRISMTTRSELIEAVGARHRDVVTSKKKTILDEFVSLTGYHRKHATRVQGTAPRVDLRVGRFDASAVKLGLSPKTTSPQETFLLQRILFEGCARKCRLCHRKRPRALL